MIRRIGLPNLITLGRILLTPLYLVGWAWGVELGELPGARAMVFLLVLGFVVEGSDKADGVIARRWDLVSSTGKLLDPFADSFSRFTVFLCFLHAGLAPIWMVAIIFYRDVIVACLRTLAAARSVVISARPSGKVKAMFQGFGGGAVFVLVLLVGLENLSEEAARTASWWIMLAITGVTAWSAVDYLLGGYEALAGSSAGAGDGRPDASEG